MRLARVILLAIIASLLQISLLPAMNIGGVVGNLVLVILVATTVWLSASEALLFAVICGGIMDMAGGGTFGLALSSLVLLCLGLVALRQLGVDGAELIVRLGLVALASFTWAVIHVAALGMSNFGLLATWRVIVGEVLINCILTLMIGRRVVYGTSKV